MPGKLSDMMKDEERQLAALADKHHEPAMEDSLQHSQVVHNPSHIVVSPSHVNGTTLQVTETAFGKLSPEIDTPSEMKIICEKQYTADTVHTVSSGDTNCHPSPADEQLFSAIKSESFIEAVVLLTTENTFTLKGLNQALISSCRRGHNLLVQTLVRVEADMEHQDEHGNTPLLICAENSFTDIVRFLVSRKANINAVNSVGDTALILSVRPAGSTDLIRFLLEQQDVDIHHENKQGHTALIRATQFMDVDTMRLLLEKDLGRHHVWGYRNSFMAREEKESIFFNNVFYKVAAEKTGLKSVFEILTEHLISKTSPLELAIKAGDTMSLDIFLDCQFSSKEEKKKYIDGALMYIFGETQLVKRFSLTDLKIIKRLLQYGADVNQGYRPKLISHAVGSGNFQLVELLCTHGADLKRYYSGNQDPLCIAAKHNRGDLIELLLKYKAEVNATDFSDSPLDHALRNDNTECAKLLILCGSMMDIKYALRSAVENQIPGYMHFLFQNYEHAVLDYFTQRPTGAIKLLNLAVEKGNSEIIGQILDAGTDVNDADLSGQIPLMISKNGEVAKFLIQRGADVNREVEDRNGTETALSYVISHRELSDVSTVELCKVLVDSGAEVDHKNKKGETPLMMAASRKDCLNLINLLLDNGAKINDKDNKGNTALFHAVLGQNFENVNCLIGSARDKKSFINGQEDEGLTPLMISVRKGNVSITNELIEKGANVNMKDNEDNTVLHHLTIVCTQNIDEILTCLLKAGSHVNCQNSDGLSPLMLAAKQTAVFLVSSLLDAGANVNAVSWRNTSQTALSYLFDHSLYFRKDNLSCIDMLMDRGASASYLSHECFHKLIIENHLKVISKLIQHGVGPADVETNKINLRTRMFSILPTVSPLRVALLVGKAQLARYFIDTVFLTSSDLSMMASSKVMECLLLQEGHDDSLNILHELSSKPMSLVRLCLVAVSTAVRSSPGRETRVDSLPLPQMIKDKLLFKSVAGEFNALGEKSPKSDALLERAMLVNLLRDLEVSKYVDSDEDDYYIYASDQSDSDNDTYDVDSDEDD